MFGLVLLLSSLQATAQDGSCVRDCGDDPTGDCFATLQAAVDAAPSGGGVTELCLDPGEYTERVTVDARALSLSPTEPPADGEYPVTIVGGLRITGPAAVTVSKLRIVGTGGARALEVLDGADVRVEGALLLGSGQKVGAGGVVRASGHALLRLSDTEMRDGVTWGNGGLVSSSGGPLELLDGCVLRDGAADRDGGLVWADDLLVDGRVELTRGTAQRNGGALLLAGSGTVRGDVHIHGNRTIDGDGGGLALEAAAELRLGAVLEDDEGHLLGLPTDDGPLLDGNTAARGDGGGLYKAHGATLTVEAVRFIGNRADEGGAVRLGPKPDSGETPENPRAVIRGSTFCRNDAQYGGVISGSGSDLDHNLFLENTADWVGVLYGADHTVVHNHFVYNHARQRDGAIDTGQVVRLHNNLIAHNTIDGTESTNTEGAVGSHNLWFDNDDRRPEGDRVTFVGDPGLRSDYLSDHQICDGVPVWPGLFDAAVDAGGAIADHLALDPDGTRLDVGAFGGATWVALFDNADGDPARDVYDCFDSTFSNPNNELDAGAAFFPGAFDAPYDDLDNDCRFDDDADGDGDGHAAREEVLESTLIAGRGLGGDDCDDSNADRFPGNVEVPGNGIDDDCDGLADEGGRLVPVASCDSAGGLGLAAFLAALAALTGAARRRRSRSTRRAQHRPPTSRSRR